MDPTPSLRQPDARPRPVHDRRPREPRTSGGVMVLSHRSEVARDLFFFPERIVYNILGLCIRLVTLYEEHAKLI